MSRWKRKVSRRLTQKYTNGFVSVSSHSDKKELRVFGHVFLKLSNLIFLSNHTFK